MTLRDFLLIGLAYSSSIKKIMYLKSLSPLDDHLTYSALASPQSFDKRDSSVQSSSVNTTSFILNFKCTSPFGDTTFSKCDQARESLRQGLEEIEKYIFLPNPVVIAATFQSFCADTDNPGGRCRSSDLVLGRAAPAQMIELTPTSAVELGLDSNYGYPSSLIRQYVPYDLDLRNVTVDIRADFNSDYNWLLAPYPGDPSWGSSVAIQGGFLNESKSVSFDLRQVAMHELMHGMGFLSSWGEYFSNTFPSTFFPSYLDFDGQGNIQGLSPQWIYDKLMSDNINGVWISSYAQAMKDSVQVALKQGGQSLWIEEFKNTSGYLVGKALFAKNGLFSSPNALLIWYPEKGSQKSLKHAVISSPNPFAPGSSLSHLDSTIYNSASSFLMRTSATSFVEFNRINPGSGNGFGAALLGIMRAMGYVVRQ